MNPAKEEKTTTLWEHFRNGRAYQTSIGLTKKLPMYVRFYEGDQWPKPTKNTQNLPRPVVNIVKMICRNKKSAILSTPVKIIYKADDDSVDVERFNRFSEYIQKEMNQDAYDKKAIDGGVKKGGYFYHYYWDSEARGKKGRQEGGIRCELIEPLNIIFSDPTEIDEQKQEWILIVSREPVKSVRAKCDSDIKPEEIVSDTAEDPYNQTEQEGSELVTVLTRYFRINGEVYFEKATKSAVINKPRSLTPNIEQARKALDGEEDAANNSLPDTNDKKTLRPASAKAYLYPIVVGNYEPKENCIYGLGEVEGLIQNQRSINFNIAMMLLSAQENGWGKYVVTADALRGQQISNEPGQVLVDYSKAGNGIKRLSEHAMPSAPMQIVDSLTQMTRVVTGSSELMTGETIGANMSGAAIAQIQAQALQPVEELKHSFWNTKEKQGKVLAQFYKLYYAEKEFTYTDMITVADLSGANKEKEVQKKDVFSGRDYWDLDLDVVVEATGGTNASVAGDISALDTALQNGGISLKTYFELYPSDALTNRTEIIKKLESEEANAVAALTQQLEAATQQLQQQSAVINEQQRTVDQVEVLIGENQRLKATISQLYTEATQKINFANQQLALGNAKIMETQGDAEKMASFIASQNASQRVQK